MEIIKLNEFRAQREEAARSRSRGLDLLRKLDPIIGAVTRCLSMSQRPKIQGKGPSLNEERTVRGVRVTQLEKSNLTLILPGGASGDPPPKAS